LQIKKNNKLKNRGPKLLKIDFLNEFACEGLSVASLQFPNQLRITMLDTIEIHLLLRVGHIRQKRRQYKTF